MSVPLTQALGPMQIPARLEEFCFVILALVAIAFPLIAAALVRWRSKYPLPRPTLFVLLSGAFAYGIGTILSFAVTALELVSNFLGAGAQYQGHHWLFQADAYLSQYGFLVLFPLLFLISIIVPVRASRSWSALVKAWT